MMGETKTTPSNGARRGAFPNPKYDGSLPAHAARAAITAAIQANRVVVVAGETGSGKTTQLPKFLISAGYGQRGRIGCTQPRRVAALSVAARIADELNCSLGEFVGAKIRFTDNTSPTTRVKLMTDGILLNEIEQDPHLRDYEVLIIDEAHERSLNIDFIIGHLRNLSRKRADLKIIITSATIDTVRFSEAFDNAPIIEVSGRTYPVVTHYRPLASPSSANDSLDETLSLVDGVVRTTSEIIAQNTPGDILVFLPTERDIHEARKALTDNAASKRCELLPLYGRMTNAEQQRIFDPDGQRRRIILATNIAETSLTVPNIRYVIDSGLARISRYSPFSRTLRLPVEPIAQSNAEQRKGRCGRVADGVCYRLYDEESFKQRPIFPTPEIHRSNLASVILRLLAFNLGEIETFPFIDPPPENAIRGAYRMLQELDAIEGDYEGDEPRRSEQPKLTAIGRRLARLPIDPAIARMLLQSSEEGVTHEATIIAAGLSVQDPRERPAENPAAADTAHRIFAHPESDFISLLKLWEWFHDVKKRLSQSQLRKHCVAHYIHFQRMREWRDIHAQLLRIQKNLHLTGKTAVEKESSGFYRAIHRSILSGNLSNVAVKENGHTYKRPRSRTALLFPGSALYDHEAKKRARKEGKRKKGKTPVPQKTTAPRWIVCGEWMETTRLYARCAARIEPEWILDLAAPLIRLRHSEPSWSPRSERVLCTERRILFGLEIDRRRVALARLDPKRATELFIQNALLDEDGLADPPDFLRHNQSVLENAIAQLAKTRTGSIYTASERLADFYRDTIPPGVGALADLRRIARVKHGGSFAFLKVAIEQLLPTHGQENGNAFPSQLNLGGGDIDLDYRHAPGAEEDGVTLRIPLGQISSIDPTVLDWAVPGHLPEKVVCLLRSLPKEKRTRLHPLKETCKAIIARLEPSSQSLINELTTILRSDYGITVYADEWRTDGIPSWHRPRIQLVDARGDAVAAGRDIEALRFVVEERIQKVDSNPLPAWRKAAAFYERTDARFEKLIELPRSIDLTSGNGLPLVAHPGLEVKADGCLPVRLFQNPLTAEEATREAWPLLGFARLGRDAAWIERDLRGLKQLGPMLLPLGDFKEVIPGALGMLQRHAFPFEPERIFPINEERIAEAVDEGRRRLQGSIQILAERLKEILTEWQECALILEKKQTPTALSFPGMRSQLERLVGPHLFTDFELTELTHTPRYLRAIILRSKRARQNLQRDIEKTTLLSPWLERRKGLLAKLDKPAGKRLLHSVDQLLEEYRVSLFAQELGTSQKVSPKRLEERFVAIEQKLR